MGMVDFADPALTQDSASANTKRKTATASTGGFNINDFYELFAAQMQNQDMMNPVDDSQFLAQITQMSSIQAMEQMNQMTMTSYAFEFMGKDVIVADYDSGNNLITTEGVVEKVTLYNGKPQVFVGGKVYDLAQVMEVKSEPKVNAADLVGRQVVYAEYDKNGNFVTESVGDSGSAEDDPENADGADKTDENAADVNQSEEESGTDDKEDGKGDTNEKKIVTQTGTVEKVTYYDGKVEIYINGKAYEQAQILEILP